MVRRESYPLLGSFKDVSKLHALEDGGVILSQRVAKRSGKEKGIKNYIQRPLFLELDPTASVQHQVSTNNIKDSNNGMQNKVSPLCDIHSEWPLRLSTAERTRNGCLQSKNFKKCFFEKKPPHRRLFF